MSTQGWPVTIAHYDFDFEIFAWRHESPGVSYTLRITQRVLEDYPPAELVDHLNRLRVAEAIGNNPGAYVLVKQEGSGVVMEVSPRAPTRFRVR